MSVFYMYTWFSIFMQVLFGATVDLCESWVGLGPSAVW